MSEDKVFVIGFQKTGTMTMNGVLARLGYSVCYENIWWKTNPDLTREDLRAIALEAAQRYDGFVNNPWPLFYKELEEKFPDAKFILTTRDTESWKESARRHFAGITRPEFETIYGIEAFDGHEDDFVSLYENHNAEVIQHFLDKPGKLLVVDITKNPEWDGICDFLGKDVPTDSFPHTNKTGSLRQRFQKHMMPFISKIRGMLPSSLNTPNTPK